MVLARKPMNCLRSPVGERVMDCFAYDLSSIGLGQPHADRHQA